MGGLNAHAIPPPYRMHLSMCNCVYRVIRDCSAVECYNYNSYLVSWCFEPSQPHGLGYIRANNNSYKDSSSLHVCRTFANAGL